MISVPTMKADSGAARCSTVEASSSGVPKRPTGTCAWICAAVARLHVMECNAPASILTHRAAVEPAQRVLRRQVGAVVVIVIADAGERGGRAIDLNLPLNIAQRAGNDPAMLCTSERPLHELPLD